MSHALLSPPKRPFDLHELNGQNWWLRAHDHTSSVSDQGVAKRLFDNIRIADVWLNAPVSQPNCAEIYPCPRWTFRGQVDEGDL